MAKIVSYEKDNQTYFKFKAYLGINQLTGKRINVSRSGFKTKREAKMVLDRLTYEFHHSREYSNDEITFKEMYEMWFPIYATTVTESTQARVRGIFEHHALPFFGNLKIADIHVQTCQRFINIVGQKISDVRKIGNYVGLVFKQAMKLEFIQKNPMTYVTYPLRTPAQKDNFWTRTELNVFLKYLDSDYTEQPKIRAYFRLMAFTGARKAELLALTVKDFDSDRKTINIDKTVSRSVDNSQIIGKTKTTNGKRVLYLDENTVNIISQWLIVEREQLLILGYNMNENDKQLIFPNTRNDLLSLMKPNTWLHNIITKYNRTHKDQLKQITPHGLRHTMATLLSQSGATMKQVQLQLGDSDLETVLNTYTHLDEQQKQETPILISNLLQRG